MILIKGAQAHGFSRKEAGSVRAMPNDRGYVMNCRIPWIERIADSIDNLSGVVI